MEFFDLSKNISLDCLNNKIIDIIVLANNIEDIGYNTLKRFLTSFDKNCLDKKSINIHLVGNKQEITTVISEFQLKINVIIYDDLISTYSLDKHIPLSLGMLKILSILKIKSNYVIMFSIYTLFIRKFRMLDYFMDYVNKFYYCSAPIHLYPCYDEIIVRNQILDDSIPSKAYVKFENIDMFWYNEFPIGIFNKVVVNDMFLFLQMKYTDLMCIPPLNFEQCYYAFYRLYQDSKNYPIVSLVDTYDRIKDILPQDTFEKLCLITPYYSLMKNSEQFLNNSFTDINLFKNIYTSLDVPIFNAMTNNLNTPSEFISHNSHINQHIFLLSTQSIIFCVCNECQMCENLINKNAYNLKIAIGISGLVRMSDNLKLIYNFIQLCSFDTYFYLATENKTNIIPTTNNTQFIIDNTNQYQTAVAKYKQPNTRDDIVSNTCAMFYKKRRLLDYIKPSHNYDMIVSLRPDLLSLDGKYLIHIILNVLLMYNKNTIYVSKMYNSLGITDTISIGSIFVMRKYLSIHDRLPEFLNSYYFNPEYLTYKHIVENGININVFDWNYKIYWHKASSLGYWWRFEFDIYQNVVDYLSMKVKSLETITKLSGTKRYIISHKATGQSLHVYDGKLQLSKNTYTLFSIRQHEDKIIRANIAIIPDKRNWSNHCLSISMKNNAINLQKECDTLTSQFYILSIDDYFLFATTDTHYLKNQNGLFGRYIGVCDEKIVSDMSNCLQSQWHIIEK